MKCAACRYPLIPKKGTVKINLDGKLAPVKNVMYEECPFCGEKVLSPKVSQELFEKLVVVSCT